MARLEDLIKFSKKHKIKIASIADIIAYRLKNEKLVYKTQTKSINSYYLKKSLFTIYKNKLNDLESFVISRGKFKKSISVPTRVLSKKINQKKIFTNSEIKKNLKLLSKFKNFLLIIINNEKKKSQINETDLTLRYYGIGAQIIKDLKVKNMILLSRAKKKIISLEGFGLKIKKQLIIK
tara:strand:- start:380 stop:916 length:537 start_codon:yes stop_codon:yes gene_type:complete